MNSATEHQAGQEPTLYVVGKMSQSELRELEELLGDFDGITIKQIKKFDEVNGKTPHHILLIQDEAVKEPNMLDAAMERPKCVSATIIVDMVNMKEPFDIGKLPTNNIKAQVITMRLEGDKGHFEVAGNPKIKIDGSLDMLSVATLHMEEQQTAFNQQGAFIS